MTKRKIVKCFRDEFAPNGMNEFEKWWSKQPNVDCRQCSQNGWLAALKWLKIQERITDGEYNVIDVRVIDKEIATNE